MARAAETGATLPGSDSAQTTRRPSWLAAVKSTPADVPKVPEIRHDRMPTRHTMQGRRDGMKPLGNVMWTFEGEEDLAELLLRLVAERLRREEKR